MSSPLDDPVSGVSTIHLWSSLHTELLWTYEGPIHPLNRRTRVDHTHGYWVWLLHRGTAQVMMDGRRLRARAGQCMVSPHGILEQSFSEDAVILSIHFNCEWPTGENLFAETGGVVFKAAEFPDFLAKAGAFSRVVGELSPVADGVHFAQQAVDFPDYLLLKSAFTEWLRAFALTLAKLGFTYNKPLPVDDRLLQAMRCLKEAPLSSPVPVGLMQRESGLGRSRLDGLFLESYGMSIRGYWNQRRLRSAKAYLTTTASPIKEVGFRLGFKQASHFTKWFHVQTGLSPAAYRRQENGGA